MAFSLTANRYNHICWDAEAEGGLLRIWHISMAHFLNQASQKDMCVVHPVLLTVVQPVSTASAISLPLPKL